MRTVNTESPSFPIALENLPIAVQPGVRWQVLCGDAGHWRAGVYSPSKTSRHQVGELEKHDCPELFLLMHGRVTLVVAEGEGLREIPLQPGRPVLVTSPHGGFCPDGPHTGTALVIERDTFKTEYRRSQEW